MIGDGMAPMMTAPASPSAVATSPRVRRWTSGSRMTPRPRDASTRPASNWGLTRTTTGDAGRGHVADQHGHGPGGRDERQVGHHQVDRDAADGVEGDLADVEPFEVRHRGWLAQARVELPVADVDGDHVGGPGLEQAVGESAGGRTGVEGPAVRSGRGRTGRVRHAASRRPRLTNGGGSPSSSIGLGRRHQPGRLVGDRARHQDDAPGDQLDGLRAAVGQPAGDQRPVEALAGGRRQSADPGCGGAGGRWPPWRRLLGGRLLGGRPSWPRAFLAGAFLAAVFLAGVFFAAAFLAAAFLAAVFLAAAFLAGLGGRPAQQGGHLGGEVLQVGDADGAELARHLGADGRHDDLGALAAPLEQLVDPGLGLVGLDVAVLHELGHQLLGLLPGHVGEGDAGVDVALECVVGGHRAQSTWSVS